MRLIDADALAKFIDYGHLNNPNEKLYSENDIREMIDMMPTQPSDDVPVIRCKDCKLWRNSPTDITEHICHWGNFRKNADDFCSWAEKEENNEA